jgi:hypothetical protein
MNKKEKLKTKFVYLDSQPIIKGRFFDSQGLRAFLKHASKGSIVLLTTDITIQECSKHASKKVASVFDKIEVLKNTEPIEDLPILKDLKKLLHKVDKASAIKENLDLGVLKIFKKHFQNIKVEWGAAQAIFNDYFSKSPPFQDSKKPKEFPDAFVLKTLEKWCKDKSAKIYLLSGDSDI